jgi:hypothetical protein
MHAILGLMMILGDCHGDGRFDLQDLQRVQSCMAGPGNSLDDPQCLCADLDGDGDSDLFDLALFQIRFEAEDLCQGASESCLTSHATPGCGDAVCCTGVCSGDPFCCQDAWDARCVQRALAVCPAMSLSNDGCENPAPILAGHTGFTNIGADTDGPFETGRCEELDMGADIWFSYTATCTGLAVMSLCGSEYDTTLAVYNGAACPTRRAVQCSDDDCADLGSRILVPVVQGLVYLIRVGGYDGETGRGLISLRCTVDGSNDDVCGPQSDACETPHRAPGCADVGFCEQRCGEDPSCCDVTWHGGCGGTFLCCVYSSRGGGRYQRCTENNSCPRPRPGYRLRNSVPVSSCDECGG